MEEANQKFDDVAWTEVMAQVEKTYVLLTEQQVELESQNKSLTSTQEFLSNIMESMTDVLLVCDRDGVIVQCNKAFEAQLCTKENQVIGTHYTDLIKLDEASLKLLGSNQSVSDINVDIVVDQVTEQFSVNCCVRQDDRLRMLGYVFIGRPIGELVRAHQDLQITHTQLKESQDHLIESEKMASLGRLVSGVAHEINNPVSFVYGNVYALHQFFERLKQQIIDTTKPIPEDVQDIFDDMPQLMEGTIEGLERVTDIITGLRNFSSIYKEESKRVDLTEIIKMAVLWTQKSHKTNIQIDNLTENGIFVYANAGKLHQLFVNLLQNAFFALNSVDAPNLVITSAVEDNKIKINFIDNGIGIEKSKLSKIFDPFYSTKKTGEGMGLGLYICYNIAKEFMGSLSAKNNPDQGMTFTLILPLMDDQDA